MGLLEVLSVERGALKNPTKLLGDDRCDRGLHLGITEVVFFVEESQFVHVWKAPKLR